MAGFRFRLEPLLRARRETEREHQRRVAAMERERQALEGRLRDHQQFIRTGKAELADRLVGAVDIRSLRAHAGATIRLTRDANRIVLELAGIYKRIEAARAELIEATKARRGLEILRERRHEEWVKGQERAETSMLDELSTNSAVRREDSSCASSGMGSARSPSSTSSRSSGSSAGWSAPTD